MSSNEREGRANPINTLTVELQAELGFEFDENKEWLTNNEIHGVGCWNSGESLPGLTRISKDGTRYQLGAHKDDIEALLSLAKLENPDVQDLEFVKNFWKDNPLIRAQEDGEMLYLEREIIPTARGLERSFGSIWFAYEAALTGAIKNISLEQADEESEIKSLIRGVMQFEGEEDRGGGSMLFGKNIFDIVDERDDQLDKLPAAAFEKPKSGPDRFSDYPIGLDRYGVNFIPGHVKYDGIERDMDDASMQFIPDPEQPYVNIFNWNTLVRDGDTLRLKLLLPEGVTVSTIDDLVRLKEAKLLGENGEEKRGYEIKVEVEDHSIQIRSTDGSLDLVMNEPCCAECKTPQWKFSDQRYVEKTTDADFHKINRLAQHNSSLGIDRFLYKKEDKENRETFCADCIPGVIDDYISRHPFARKGAALDIMRAKLDQMGNSNVYIYRDMAVHQGNKWGAYLETKYERDGREIIRYCGEMYTTDDGEVLTDKIKPQEYINFRSEKE